MVVVKKEKDKEKYPTTLCKTKKIIRELILDCHGILDEYEGGAVIGPVQPSQLSFVEDSWESGT